MILDRKIRFGKQIRADLNFDKEIEDIIQRRIKLGKENPRRPNGTRRITAAIRRHDLWPEIKKDIILADLEEDRNILK